MDIDRWRMEFTEARQRLLASNDFGSLHSRGHNLEDGAVLTSVSDVPFEMSIKCHQCGVVWWFENLAWSTGGIAEWRLGDSSREASGLICAATKRPGDICG
jgi:hypothetical protein